MARASRHSLAHSTSIQTRIFICAVFTLLAVLPASSSPLNDGRDASSFPERIQTHEVFPTIPIELTMALVSLCSVITFCAISLVVICAFSVLFFWFLVYKVISRVGAFARERVDVSGNFIAARYDRATAYWSGAYEDVIAFTKPRVDSWLWWYKASVITKMATSAFKCYVGAFGAPFGGQGGFETACQTVRMCPEGKHDKNLKTPFSYIHGLLVTVGIVGYAFYGRVPAKIKDALWVHGSLPDFWDLYSNITGQFFNWFSVGHVNGCTCRICELEREATPEGMDPAEWSKLFREIPPTERPTVVKTTIPVARTVDADGNELTENQYTPGGDYPMEEIRTYKMGSRTLTVDEYADFVQSLKKPIHSKPDPIIPVPKKGEQGGLGHTIRTRYDAVRNYIQNPGTKVEVIRIPSDNPDHISNNFVAGEVLKSNATIGKQKMGDVNPFKPQCGGLHADWEAEKRKETAKTPTEEEVNVQVISNILNADISDPSGPSTGTGLGAVHLEDEGVVQDIYAQKSLSGRFHIAICWALTKMCGPFTVKSFRPTEGVSTGFKNLNETCSLAPTLLVHEYPNASVEIEPGLVTPRGHSHIETVTTKSKVYNWYASNATMICNTLEIVVYASIYAAFAYGAYRFSKSLNKPPAGTIMMPKAEVDEVVRLDTSVKAAAKRNLAVGVAAFLAKPALKMILHGSSRVAKFVVNGSQFNVYDFDSNAVAINGKREIPLSDDAFIRWIDDAMSAASTGKLSFIIRNPDGTKKMIDAVKMRDQSKRKLRAKFNKHEHSLRKEAALHAKPPKCRYCQEEHHHVHGCQLKAEAWAETQKIFVAKFTPEVLQGVRTRIDMKRISDRLFKMYCAVGSDVLFKCNGFLFGEKLVTVKHGFESYDGTPFGGAMAQSGLSSYHLPPYVDIPEAGGDLIYFPMKSKVSPMGRVSLASPKNGEAVFLIAYDHENDGLPSITHGTINEAGYHSCPSIPGNCAGVLVNEDGAVVGFHQAGSKQVNKCIPCTPAVISSLQAGF